MRLLIGRDQRAVSDRGRQGTRAQREDAWLKDEPVRDTDDGISRPSKDAGIVPVAVRTGPSREPRAADGARSYRPRSSAERPPGEARVRRWAS